MAEIIKKIENLKPGKNYIFSVRTKNTDINAYSESIDSILVSIPKDTTIPDAISNLALYASFENVMFVFDFSNDLDIDKYEYELYNNGAGTGTATSTGFSSANVFTVAVPNSTDTVAKTYWGRVRSIDTTGNAGPWTALTQTDQATPLINSQYISNLTASKITAGTIGAHTITLAGANSILRSNNYTPATANTGGLGWKISGDGNAVFNNASIRSSLDIGEDLGTSDATSFHVDVTGNMWSGANSTSFSVAPFRVTNTGDVTANSLVLTGTTKLSNSGNASLFLTNNADGIGLYNNANTPFYVDATDQFSLGNKLTWANNTLTIQGILKLNDGSDVLDAADVEIIVDEFGNEIQDGFIGGLTINSTQMYYGVGTFASSDTAFYVAKNNNQANFSLGDKLTWNGSTLSITGNVVITGGSTLADINDAKDAADDAKDAADAAQSDADAAYAYADAAFDNANNKITIGGAGISVDNDGKLTQISGDVIRTGLIASPGNTSYIDLNDGTFNFGSGSISWNGSSLDVNGDISGCSGTFTGALSGATISGGSININNNFRVDTAGSVACRNITVDSGLTYRGESFATSASTTTARVDNIGVDRFVKATSKREYKENIVDISNGLQIINQLQPREFNFKQSYFGEIDPSTEQPWTAEARVIQSLFRTYGFIVDEVQDVDPGLVAYEPSEVGNLDISQWKASMWKDLEIIALLTKAVQELSAKVEELESKLNS